MPLQATSGAASYDAFGGGVPVVPAYIEEVFSTYLYTGTGSALTITNNIDLSTNGGMVWFKNRNGTFDHSIFDTVRGVTKSLRPNDTVAEATETDGLTAFNTNGFTIGNWSRVNYTTSDTYASWTFRKQPKFFDVVTYTGNGTTQNIAHNLGSVPGCIIVKNTSNAGQDWFVYHRTQGNGYGLLNTTDSWGTYTGYWNDTAPTSTQFSVGTSNGVNGSGRTYVAYLFAHDAGGFGLTGTDNVISCGSYTGNGLSAGPTVTLGYEPQWLLIKRTNSTSNWTLIDNMRGIPTGYDAARLFPNLSNAEITDQETANLLATGFKIATADAPVNASGGTYIYIAIRRGPMKVPTSGTSVFYPNAISQAETIDSTNVPFPPDLVNTFSRNGTDRSVGQMQFVDRLRSLGTPNNSLSGNGGPALLSASTAAEGGSPSYVQLKADSQNITRSSGWNSASYGNWIYYFIRRAPSFFDEVCFSGTGSARTVTHNLTVVPELMIVKQRSNTAPWAVYDATNGPTKWLELQDTRATTASTQPWNNTAPTSSVFTVGTSNSTNGSGETFVAYLFATCAGVSKVGTYTGTATTLQVNCGFTGGARFVLIKRTDSTGDWYVWDSARGIIAGNDPYLLLNSTAAEVTNTDYVDTYSAGFEISSTAPAAINASAGTFIFLAIA